MQETTNTQPPNEHQGIESADARLEEMLIEQYLRDKGHTWTSATVLPADEAKHLLTDACRYAALKLTEIEATAHLWSDVEGKV